MESRLWLFFAVLAGLCWGTYVPLIAFGGRTLKDSYASFLCVGVAYFLIAILAPLAYFWTQGKMPGFNVTGTVFATLAGVAGALGALCVILGRQAGGGDPKVALYLAPIIFGLAPILNTLVSLVWHPSPNAPLHFGLPEVAPGWKLYVGILLTAVGAALVLYSKEESEVKHAKGPGPAHAVAASATDPR